uniref:Uncharacterized protein n=1 Tax=Oryza punctata TaxID=4537 RepID=A0A0E0JUX9_ORYPU
MEMEVALAELQALFVFPDIKAWNGSSVSFIINSDYTSNNTSHHAAKTTTGRGQTKIQQGIKISSNFFNRISGLRFLFEPHFFSMLVRFQFFITTPTGSFLAHISIPFRIGLFRYFRFRISSGRELLGDFGTGAFV